MCAIWSVKVNRIKELRTAKNIKQIDLCKQIGVSQGALSGWENEKYEPDLASLSKLSVIFDVSIDYLLGKSDESEPARKKGIKIPVLGTVAAGIPIEAIEDILDYEEITEEMASQGEYFGLQIRGNSMEPRIKEGDVVIVRRQSDIESGDIAVVLVNGYDATVKKVVKHENGLSLIAYNAAVYEPHFYTCEEVETLPVQILGRVVELRGKF